MIGNRNSDTPVLAAGDVGIAMEALESQVSVKSASIALMGSYLDRLPFDIIYQNEPLKQFALTSL